MQVLKKQLKADELFQKQTITIIPNLILKCDSSLKVNVID
jgi:hypothetical protein